MRRCALSLLLAFAGCGANGSPSPPGALRHADGVTYRVPSGWHVAPHSLTPHLVNPRELFTAGTGRLATAPQRCAMVPSGALAAMHASDVLVTVQERFGSVASFPARPERFALGPAPQIEADECAGLHPAFVGHLSEFGEGGRGFHVLVAVGRSASRARVNEALSILDSLHIQARKPVRMSPNFSLPEHIAAAGIDFVHQDAWRFYRRPLTQLGEPVQRLALGTFRLHQHSPDPNCSPVTALRERPPHGGFLFLYETRGLSRAQLARIPRRPARLALSGPRPYECFGSSWRVDFRDGGRAFTAHVYGPPRRRSEALAILDSLRIRPAPFEGSLHAARFPARSGWRTRVSGPQHEGGCLQRQRTSWASTVPFTDGASSLPPHRMIAALPPDGIVIAVVQWRECRALRGVRALEPPLSLARAARSGFPGPRGDELPLYRVTGRFAGRYYVDVWVFYGRRNPTAPQRAAAQGELSGVRWPAWL